MRQKAWIPSQKQMWPHAWLDGSLKAPPQRMSTSPKFFGNITLSRNLPNFLRTSHSLAAMISRSDRLWNKTLLSPLQSRFLASLLALAFIGTVYYSLASRSYFAYAAELDVDGSGRSRGGADHNWHRIQQLQLEEDGVEPDTSNEHESDGDEREGAGDNLYRRVTDPVAISGNNEPNSMNLLPGNSTLWKYSSTLLAAPPASTGSGLPGGGVEVQSRERVDLRRRDDEAQIYISINTCLQPTWNGTGLQTVAPPQLTLYVSKATSNENPEPSGSNSTRQAIPLNEGFANYTLLANGDWYMSVYAPALPEGFVGGWNYELAVSTQDYYHSAVTDDPFVFLVDTDTHDALFVTDNLTLQDPSSDVYKAWMNTSPPFIMFAANANHTATQGIMNSYCGWSKNAQISGDQTDPAGQNSNVQMRMITRGLGNNPKEQIYITNQNASSTYVGVLAMTGNSTAAGSGVVGGGGKVWGQGVSWTTKSDGNCALLFDLDFCDQVAYAVPSNYAKYNTSGMRTLFDNYTSTYYQNFNYSLQQIPCNTTSDAQYSLAQNCTTCAAAYKQWLCAVSIPRCEDYSSTADFLQPRNVGQAFANGSSLAAAELAMPYVPMTGAPTLHGSPRDQQTLLSAFATNSSRIPALVDTLIQPGPYKELLPCDDLCYGLIQACPASLGFACPAPGRGLEVAYGRRSPNGSLSCSFLGAVYGVVQHVRLVGRLDREVLHSRFFFGRRFGAPDSSGEVDWLKHLDMHAHRYVFSLECHGAIAFAASTSTRRNSVPIPQTWTKAFALSRGRAPDATGDAREALPVAEAVGGDDGPEAAGAQEEEGGEEAEKRGVGEHEGDLQQGEGERGKGGVALGGWGAGADEFDEVVHMRETEDQRGGEDDGRRGDAGEQVQGDDEGAEDELFAQRRDDEVAVAGPGVPEGLLEVGEGEVAPGAVDDEGFVERAQEEDAGQQERTQEVDDVERVEAQQVQDGGGRDMAEGGEEGGCD
nr:calcium influx-promoting protein ehs1 [Quercus suber]